MQSFVVATIDGSRSTIRLVAQLHRLHHRRRRRCRPPPVRRRRGRISSPPPRPSAHRLGVVVRVVVDHASSFSHRLRVMIMFLGRVRGRGGRRRRPPTSDGSERQSRRERTPRSSRYGRARCPRRGRRRRGGGRLRPEEVSVTALDAMGGSDTASSSSFQGGGGSWCPRSGRSNGRFDGRGSRQSRGRPDSGQRTRSRSGRRIDLPAFAALAPRSNAIATLSSLFLLLLLCFSFPGA